MAPLSWLTLYMLFTIIFLLFNVMNYYSFLYSIQHSTFKKKKISLNWKW
uniref:ATP synthase F0 subunit 8 n=1 Tax=Phalacridae sp. BMNH 840198 TaxID=904146 RepID=I7EGB1_9CUCU|nr:ATP synthase F0 subunit 8 [Phalacridae sp. BMNH 840198]